jgi:DNA-directed RNA polymerase specialized sigma24 family protein
MSPRSSIDLLERDWQRELNTPLLRTRFCMWREREPALSRFADPAALVHFLRGPGAHADKDAVLCALLRWARQEPVGARVVLEAIRPGLLRLAGRVLVDAREREDLWALLFEVAWEEIRGYPVERRPRRVAANLLLDTLHRIVGELRRGRVAQAALSFDAAQDDVPASGDGDADVVDDVDGGEVDALLDRAVRAGAITPGEAQVILASRFDGAALASLASSSGVPYNTMKLRRQRAERRLLVFLGHRPVPRGQQYRPSSGARVSGI